MSSKIPTRPFSTPSPLQKAPSESGTASERGTTERGSSLRSSGHSAAKCRMEGDIEKVKVYARIRPALRDDETPGALVWSDDGHLTIFRPDAPVPQSDFLFDKVLGPDCSQADVYTAAVSDVVGDVLRGYNGTILAYGQTGAGKTFTLGNTAPDAIGMIPRAAAELFAAAARDHLHTYRITMSYIQIYMEMVQDLLNPTADNLPVREDANGVFVAGACEVPVSSLEECLHYLELGEQNRIFAFTHLNAHSSRSHAVVMLTAVKGRKYLTTEEREQAEAPDQDGVVAQKVTVGKLYMVDLAGSERLKKSRSVGLRATEARSINLSLTMLGMCISARAQDSPHVPFRDSKLTRILQESLGGNARTSLILCLSDVRQHADESLQSLQFGARAACVRNKPVVNERVHMRQLTEELLAALEEGHERADGLEAALSQTKEERDALQAALAREKARSAAIADALRVEAETRQAQAAARLAEQAELLSTHVQQLGQVQQQQGQLEMEVARLRSEQRVREEAHRAEMAALQERLAAVQAAATRERAVLEAEARSQQTQLAAAAQRQTAVLAAKLLQERAAARDHAASIHLALTRLQQALGALAEGSTHAAEAPAEQFPPLASRPSLAAGRQGSTSPASTDGKSFASDVSQAFSVADSARGGNGGQSLGVQDVAEACHLSSADDSTGAFQHVSASTPSSHPSVRAVPADGVYNCSRLLHTAPRQYSSDLADLDLLRAAAGEGLAGGLQLSTPDSTHLQSSTPTKAACNTPAADILPSGTPAASSSAGVPLLPTPPCSPPPAARALTSGNGSYAAAHAAAVAVATAVGAPTSPWRQPAGHNQLHGGAASQGGASGATKTSCSPGESPSVLRKWSSLSASASTGAALDTALQAPGPVPGSSLPQPATRPSSAPAVVPSPAEESLTVLQGKCAATGAAPGDAVGGADDVASKQPYVAAVPTSPSALSTSTMPLMASAVSGTGRTFSSAFGHEYSSSPSAVATAATPAVAAHTAFGLGYGSSMSSSAPASAGVPTYALLPHAYTHPGMLSLNPAYDTVDSDAFATEDVSIEVHTAAATSDASTAAPFRTPSEAGALLSTVPPAPAASTAAAVGPSPLFAGIQVQLNALWDMVEAAKRIKTGLEAQALLQAGDLARMREEQRRAKEGAQEVLAQLQTTREALASVEAQLAGTTSELEATRNTLAETVQALDEIRRTLDERNAALDVARRSLDDTAGRLQEAAGRADDMARALDDANQALESSKAEDRRLTEELAKALADLEAERAALQSQRAASERCTEVSAQAMGARHEVQRQIRAANTVKHAYKRYKLARLQNQIAVNNRALAEAEKCRRQQEAAQAARAAAQSARAGQVLVQESVAVMKDAVGAILAAFVGRRYELEATRALNDRLTKILPSAAPSPLLRGSNAGAWPAMRSGGGGTSGGGSVASPTATPLQGCHSLSLMLAAATPPSLQPVAAGIASRPLSKDVADAVPSVGIPVDGMAEG